MRAVKESSPPRFLNSMSTLALDTNLVAQTLVRHRQKKAEEEEMLGRENYEEDMEHVSDIRTVFGI